MTADEAIPKATAVLTGVKEVQESKGSNDEATLSTLPLISAQRRDLAQKDNAIDLSSFEAHPAHQASSTSTILYLAYGSNLSAATFKGTRGIRPISQLNVVVPEVRLTFDLAGIPYKEPCFANLQYRRNASAPDSSHRPETSPLLAQTLSYHKDQWKKGLVGVVYEVSRDDFATIIRTEGGGSSYADIVVDCYPLESGASTVPTSPKTQSFKAHTLYCACGAANNESTDGVKSKSSRVYRPDPSYAQPSARYKKLLTDGAAEHHIPLEYRDYLASIRPYTITQRRQRVGQFIFVGIWFPIVMSLFAFQRQLADKHGRIPPWVAAISNTVFRGIWLSYDYIFRPIFGDGERTISDKNSYARRPHSLAMHNKDATSLEPA